MGIVYEAIHEEIGRRAAIKVLASRGAKDPRDGRRFLNEARAISRVRHAGLVQIYDFGETASGTPYILMELLDGESLRSRLATRAREGRVLSIIEVRRTVRQIAAALAATHAEGIVHRDLKPDNVMLVADEEAPGGERVKLLDFGIARFVDSMDPAITSPNAVVGTVAYMSPEQCEGHAGVGAAADVYALGVMLHELLAGAPPFEGENGTAVMCKHVLEAPPPPPAGTPPDLTKLVARMLAKAPPRRPSMRDIVEALAERFGPEEAAPARRPPAPDEEREEREERQGVQTLPDAPAARAAARGGSAEADAATRDGSAEAEAASPVARPARRHPAIRAAVLAAAMLVAVVVVWRWGLGSRGLAAPTPPGVPRMVWFPGGTFRMGLTGVEAETECKRLGQACIPEQLGREQPARDVTLSSFYLDQLETTNDEVARWLTTMRSSIEVRMDDEQKRRWVYLDGVLLLDLDGPDARIVRGPDGDFSARPGYERHPVLQITWDGASQYCASRGKRLPTEAEWERAARGLAGRRFPWGDQEPRCDQVAWGRDGDLPCAQHSVGGEPLEVGAAPLDRTPEGIRDLGGNVQEWVQDQFIKPYLPVCGDCVNPISEQPISLERDFRVVRGGTWMFGWDMSRATKRSRFKRTGAVPNIGVRCATR
jgi:serine/threonine-protein kinase